MKHILLTNDDGITAKGLTALRECFASDDYRISIVAPLLEMSAVSHGLTTNGPIRLQEMHLEGGLIVYGVEGTPADCVKLALRYLLKDDRPDVLISGINQGENTGYNILYSGTVAAAYEGLFEGIPSIAISIATFYPKSYSQFYPLIRRIVDWWSTVKEPEYLLNLNLPPVDTIMGLKIVRQGRTRFREILIPQEDPRGRQYFWLGGELLPDTSEDTENANLTYGYATLSPLSFDLTYYMGLKALEEEFKEK